MNKMDVKKKNNSKATKDKKNKYQKVTNKKNATKNKVDNQEKVNKKTTEKQNIINNKRISKRTIKKNTDKISYKDLTVSQIEKELKRETYKSKYRNVLMTTIYSLIIIASIATIIATMVMPVLQISTSSMANTYNEGDIVVSIKTKNIESGDVIAFYHGNKILVKRVIATSGSWVVMDEDGNVSVNGEPLEEHYLENKVIGEYDIQFPYQVPDGKYFVLSDQRQESIDSRNSEIGCISQEDVIGKILFRIWPLNK